MKRGSPWVLDKGLDFLKVWSTVGSWHVKERGGEEVRGEGGRKEVLEDRNKR